MTPSADTLVVGAAPDTAGAAHYTAVIRSANRIIAADAGLALCLAAGRVPDLCIGDFDSVDPALLLQAERSGAEIRRFPTMKDESDLDLAVTAARELGARRLRVIAAFTGRLDHTLAALGTLLAAVDLQAEADEPTWRGIALAETVRSTLMLAEPEGTVLSLMAPCGATVSINGVRYPLDAHVIPPLSSLGLSNVVTGTTQTVILHRGSALVLVNRAEGTLPLS